MALRWRALSTLTENVGLSLALVLNRTGSNLWSQVLRANDSLRFSRLLKIGGDAEPEIRDKDENGRFYGEPFPKKKNLRLNFDIVYYLFTNRAVLYFDSVANRKVDVET